MEELTCPFPRTSITESSTGSGAQGLTGGPGPQMDGWLSVALEEYKSIRTESLDSMKVQNTILSYGATTIGVILTAGISIIDKNMLLADEAIFLVFIPLIVFFIVMIWAGEVARSIEPVRFWWITSRLSVDTSINCASLKTGTNLRLCGKTGFAKNLAIMRPHMRSCTYSIILYYQCFYFLPSFP